MATTLIERWLAEDGTSSIHVVHDDATGLYEVHHVEEGRLFAHLELTQVRLWLLGVRGDDEPPPPGGAPIDL